MKEFALITGGTAGIGYELAKLFAADHFNLILVARDEARLKKVAAELRESHKIEAIVLSKDLSNSSAPREIFDAVQNTPVSVLVNNAGFGSQGAFADEKPDLSLNMMHVNMDVLVQLTRLFLPPMLSRGEGRILNVGSTAGFQPGPSPTFITQPKLLFFHSLLPSPRNLSALASPLRPFVRVSPKPNSTNGRAFNAPPAGSR